MFFWYFEHLFLAVFVIFYVKNYSEMNYIETNIKSKKKK